MDQRAEESVSESTAVTAKELKSHLGDFLGRVQFGGEQLVVTKNGKPAAALIPIETLALLRRLEDRGDVEAARSARAEAKAVGTISLAELRASLGL
jgi:prevent-host-death family protein